MHIEFVGEGGKASAAATYLTNVSSFDMDVDTFPLCIRAGGRGPPLSAPASQRPG